MKRDQRGPEPRGRRKSSLGLDCGVHTGGDFKEKDEKSEPPASERGWAELCGRRAAAARLSPTEPTHRALRRSL